MKLARLGRRYLQERVDAEPAVLGTVEFAVVAVVVERIDLLPMPVTMESRLGQVARTGGPTGGLGRSVALAGPKSLVSRCWSLLGVQGAAARLGSERGPAGQRCHHDSCSIGCS